MSDNPFSPRAVLALVLGGGLLFIAILWMVASGFDGGDNNDGGAHVGGKGLTGYAALAQLLEAGGIKVQRSRTRQGLRAAGLLVLTPTRNADPKELDRIITARRAIGPTLLIVPKWMALPIRASKAYPAAKPGWVQMLGIDTPAWVNKVEALGSPEILFDKEPGASGRLWTGLGQDQLPAPDKPVQFLGGDDLVALVRNGSGQFLAAYLDDGDYIELADSAGQYASDYAEEENRFPVTLVAEPDLLNNYGLADNRRAALALALVGAARNGADGPVLFDLTLPGHGAGKNLLTLAFTPPFLAATLCLLLAALVVGWRAFARFGPAKAAARAIAFGKTALVGNAAGLIRRARRLHLLGGPYADAARERLAKALALPARLDAAGAETAIDRALAARDATAAPFSTTAAALRAARKPRELIIAARDLHSLERILIR
jgi:hypothetical protein